MPSNFLLLLPLVGGYLFNHILYRLRFRAQAQDGYRLILEAAVSGIFFLGIARVLTGTVIALGGRAEWLVDWGRLTNFTPFSGTSCVAAILAPLCAFVGNFVVGFRHRELTAHLYSDKPIIIRQLYCWRTASRNYCLDLAIRNSGNALQKLLHAVAVNGRRAGITVGLTLSNGKIYAAFVTTSPNLSPQDDFVSLLPIMSGHRDPDSLKIVYDFAYPLKKFEELATGEQVVVAVPISEIRSAHILDEQYYREELSRLLKASEKPVGARPRTFFPRLLSAIVDDFFADRRE